MAAKKRTVTQEHLLSTVARKLGHAAGTLTKVTQELADNVSAVPKAVAAKVRQAAQIRETKVGESTGSARGRIRHDRKKLSRAVRPRRTKARATGVDTSQRSPRQRALRRKARASNLKK
jgi:hypothetical protein